MRMKIQVANKNSDNNTKVSLYVHALENPYVTCLVDSTYSKLKY